MNERPAAAPPPASSPSSSERKPVRGEDVLYREGELDLHAVVADVDTDGRATIAILTRIGQWRALSSIARDPNPDFPASGQWRFKK